MIDFYIENIELRRLIVSKKQLTFTIQYLFLNTIIDFSNTKQSTFIRGEICKQIDRGRRQRSPIPINSRQDPLENR